MLEIGDIVVVQSDTVVGRVIRFVTNSWASHVCVFVGDGRFFEARPSRAGYTHIDRYSSDGYSWRVYRLKTTEESKRLFVSKLIEKEGRKYDYAQILWLFLISLLGLRSSVSTKTSNNRSICSEVVFEALAESGIKLHGKQSNIVPGDFENFDLLERIH